MAWAIVYPCAGLRTKVRRINMSRVPWGISDCSGEACLGIWLLAPVDHRLEYEPNTAEAEKGFTTVGDFDTENAGSSSGHTGRILVRKRLFYGYYSEPPGGHAGTHYAICLGLRGAPDHRSRCPQPGFRSTGRRAEDARGDCHGHRSIGARAARDHERAGGPGATHQGRRGTLLARAGRRRVP